MNKGNRTNHRRKWLTVDKFDNFVNNHFHALKAEVRWHTWLLLVIALAVISKLVIDFLWG